MLHARDTPDGSTVVFATGDDLMQDAYGEFDGPQDLMIVGTFDRIEEIIAELSSKISEALLEAARDAAKAAFSLIGDDSSIYYAGGVGQNVLAKSDAILGSYPGIFVMGSSKLKIGDPTMFEKDGSNYTWRSNVTRHFEVVSVGAAPESIFTPSVAIADDQEVKIPRMIRKAYQHTFRVTWRFSYVDGQVQDPEVISIELVRDTYAEMQAKRSTFIDELVRSFVQSRKNVATTTDDATSEISPHISNSTLELLKYLENMNLYEPEKE